MKPEQPLRNPASDFKYLSQLPHAFNKKKVSVTTISIDEWLLNRKKIDINESLDAIQKILDELINNAQNKRHFDTISRQKIKHNDTVDYQYCIDYIDSPYENEKENERSQVLKLSQLFMRFFLPNTTKEHSSTQLIKMLNELFFMICKGEEFSAIIIPETIDEVLKEDFMILFNRMSAPDPKDRPTLAFLQTFFSSIKHRPLLIEKALSCNRIISYINSLYKDLGTDAAVSLLQVPSHITATIESMDNNDSLETIYSDDSVNDLDAIASKRDDLLKLYCDSQNIFSQLNSAKFKGTNSDGIKKIQAILADSGKTIIEKIHDMHVIGKQKTDNTLSNWMKRHSFFGKGRHQNIEQLYQALASIKLDPDTKKSDLMDGHLETIISTIKTIVENHESFVYQPDKGAGAHIKV